MEVDEIRRLALREKKAHDVIRPISEEISAERNRAIDRDIFGEQTFKPLVRMQEKVQRELRDEDKKGIDERQDALIGKLEENQEAIVERLNKNLDINMGDFMEMFMPEELEYLKAIQIDVQKLSDYNIEQLMQMREGALNMIKNKKKQKNSKQKTFQILALTKISDVLRSIISIKQHLRQKGVLPKRSYTSTGSGTRNYKQPKRHAYKVSKGGNYGGLTINVPRLMNEMILEAKKDGQKIYENKIDADLIHLLTKKFDPKKRYSSMARQVFNDLNMISEIPIHRSSGKSKIGGGNVYYSKPEDLIKRLKLLTGTRQAGNNNLQIRNEIWQIIDHLHKSGEITKEQHDAYVNKFLM